MKKINQISLLFLLSALYDGLLGLLFLFAAEPVFRWFGVTHPNHFGYVKFPALLLLIFGIMFFKIAKNPRENRDLIPFGILLKLSYCGTVFYYWYKTGIPYMWKPFAIYDLIFLVLFILAYYKLSKPDESKGN